MAKLIPPRQPILMQTVAPGSTCTRALFNLQYCHAAPKAKSPSYNRTQPKLGAMGSIKALPISMHCYCSASYPAMLTSCSHQNSAALETVYATPQCNCMQHPNALVCNTPMQLYATPACNCMQLQSSNNVRCTCTVGCQKQFPTPCSGI